VVVNLVIPKGTGSASYHLERLGTDSVWKWLVLRRQPPQGLHLPSQVAPSRSSIGSFRKQGGVNIFAFPNQLPFLRISRPLALNGTTDRPSIDNPETVGSRNSYSRINDFTSLSNLRFSRKSRHLETSQNSASKKDDQSFRPSRPTRGHELDPPSSGLPTCANTC
jgi:hypothetical protein